MKNPYTKTQQKQITKLYELIKFYEELPATKEVWKINDRSIRVTELKRALAIIENSVPENLKG